VLEVREGKKSENQVDASALFRAYLEAVTRVVEEMDLRLQRGADNLS
jgi:hypothetical protein